MCHHLLSLFCLPSMTVFAFRIEPNSIENRAISTTREKCTYIHVLVNISYVTLCVYVCMCVLCHPMTTGIVGYKRNIER